MIETDFPRAATAAAVNVSVWPNVEDQRVAELEDSAAPPQPGGVPNEEIPVEYWSFSSASPRNNASLHGRERSHLRREGMPIVPDIAP